MKNFLEFSLKTDIQTNLIQFVLGCSWGQKAPFKRILFCVSAIKDSRPKRKTRNQKKKARNNENLALFNGEKTN